MKRYKQLEESKIADNTAKIQAIPLSTGKHEYGYKVLGPVNQQAHWNKEFKTIKDAQAFIKKQGWKDITKYTNEERKKYNIV